MPRDMPGRSYLHDQFYGSRGWPSIAPTRRIPEVWPKICSQVAVPPDYFFAPPPLAAVNPDTRSRSAENRRLFRSGPQ